MELNAYQTEAEVDVRAKEGLHLPAAVLERLAAEVNRPFDLAGGGPLMRILLLRCPGGTSVVLFNMHHIVGECGPGVFSRQLSRRWVARQPAACQPSAGTALGRGRF